MGTSDELQVKKGVALGGINVNTSPQIPLFCDM